MTRLPILWLANQQVTIIALLSNLPGGLTSWGAMWQDKWYQYWPTTEASLCDCTFMQLILGTWLCGSVGAHMLMVVRHPEPSSSSSFRWCFFYCNSLCSFLWSSLFFVLCVSFLFLMLYLTDPIFPCFNCDKKWETFPGASTSFVSAWNIFPTAQTKSSIGPVDGLKGKLLPLGAAEVYKQCFQIMNMIEHAIIITIQCTNFTGHHWTYSEANYGQLRSTSKPPPKWPLAKPRPKNNT